MLKRPNPYRKTRAAGTLDDLMFDMDKRRHTSFRFQNYQNFITDRPGKFVSIECVCVDSREISRLKKAVCTRAVNSSKANHPRCRPRCRQAGGTLWCAVQSYR